MCKNRIYPMLSSNFTFRESIHLEENKVRFYSDLIQESEIPGKPRKLPFGIFNNYMTIRNSLDEAFLV